MFEQAIAAKRRKLGTQESAPLNANSLQASVADYVDYVQRSKG